MIEVFKYVDLNTWKDTTGGGGVGSLKIWLSGDGVHAM
jgi:hypothetical protein